MKSTGLTCFQGIGSIVALVCVFFAVPAHAHEPSKGYLNLAIDYSRSTGRLDLPLVDLLTIVPLKAGEKGSVPREQLEAHYQEITAYVSSHLQFKVDGHALTPQFPKTAPALEEWSEGTYLPLDLVLDHSPIPQELEIGYQLFFKTNFLHRGLVRLESGGDTRLTVFSPFSSSQVFELGRPSGGRQFLIFLREGVWHIWMGYDHILFLLALLLPSVLQREGGQWQVVTALRPAFHNVLKIVTAFTVAHSLTLTLATLGIVRLPPRFIESAIAVSVILAAANNLWPLFRGRAWIVAFGFGLVHGFGFANALGDLGVTQGRLALTLFSFNAGVELGQLAIVAFFLPAAYGLRRTWLYQTPLLRLGSACVILIAGAWCAERMLDLKFMPF